MSKELRKFNRLKKAIMVMSLFLACFVIPSQTYSYDGCISDDNLVDEIISGIATIGFSEVFRNGFTMKSGAQQEGETAVPKCANGVTSCPCNPTSPPTFADGTKAMCGDNGETLPRCNAPVFVDGYSDPTYSGTKITKVKYCFDKTASFFLNLGLECNLVTNSSCCYEDGPDATHGGNNIRVKIVNDKICVQYWTLAGWFNLGCKYIVPPSSHALATGCMTGASCSDRTARNAQSFLPITSVAMQCMQETLNKVFVNPGTCNTGTMSMFPTFQASMRGIVKILLTLYVIFFGIRIALGGEIPQKSELFIFGLKLVLVMYFSVGIVNKSGVYEDGVTLWIMPAVQSISNGLAQIVFSASSGQICTYNPSEYPANYGYLALWDAIDCRLGFYLGFNNPNNALGVGMSTLFSMVLPGILDFQLIFVAACICMTIFLLSITLYFLNTYIIALIALTIIGYFAPIFVPLALFRQTKSYFDSWAKLLISFAVQPMMITAFMALMLAVFDQIFYGTCQWTQSTVFNILGGNNVKFWTINSSTDPSCTSTVGYHFSMFKNGEDFLTSVSLVLFDIVTLNASVAPALLMSLLKLAGLGFLFYQFAEMLTTFAADLSGGPALGELSQLKPNSVNKVAIEAAQKYIDAKTGGAASKAKAGIEGVSGSSEEEGGGGGGGQKGGSGKTVPRGGGGSIKGVSASSGKV